MVRLVLGAFAGRCPEVVEDLVVAWLRGRIGRAFQLGEKLRGNIQADLPDRVLVIPAGLDYREIESFLTDDVEAPDRTEAWA